MDDLTGDPGPNAQAQAIFGQHHKEISRRSNLVESDSLNPSSFPRAKDSSETFSFRMPGQSWVLFSVSHIRMPPVCEDPRKPAVRFYGLFDTAEDATDHAKVVMSVDSSANIQLCRSHDWVAMCSTPESLSADDETREHVQKVIDAYKAKRQTADNEFHENVESKKGGKGLKDGLSEKEARISREAKEAANTILGEAQKQPNTLCRAPRLPRAAEVRDQAMIVVSFLPDTLKIIPEPLFQVYGAFNSQTEADAYIRNTAGDIVRDFDMYVVSACEWIFPQDVDTLVIGNEIYRSDELNSVMSNHKEQPQKIENFTKWRDSTDHENV